MGPLCGWMKHLASGGMAVSERGNHCPLKECGMISIVVAMDANQLIGANHKCHGIALQI